jgi:hypothetical protein
MFGLAVILGFLAAIGVAAWHGLRRGRPARGAPELRRADDAQSEPPLQPGEAGDRILSAFDETQPLL